MLFNSFPFLFVFLPVVLLGYQLLGRLGRMAGAGPARLHARPASVYAERLSERREIRAP